MSVMFSKFPVWVVVAASTFVGAMVGSFLNVCIHRLPRGMSVGSPARSFCPACNRTIPWFENIPVFSWLFLRGKCSGCGASIPIRYVGVEILTAVLFGALALKFTGQSVALILPNAFLISILLVATFVDLEHMIIPDQVTWGGVLCGGIFALWIPELHGAPSRWESLERSMIGAAVGFGMLWTVVEVGRLVFGKKKFTFDQPVDLVWARTGETAELVVEDESIDWAGLFPRGSESVLMEFETAHLDGDAVGGTSAKWGFETLHTSERSVDLNTVERFTCRLRAIVLPREVMGFGDVKFIAAIGAFTGWKGALFSVMAGSISGALFGVLAPLLGRREWSGKIPFGPYLAFGAMLWLAIGPEAWRAYWSFFLGGP